MSARPGRRVLFVTRGCYLDDSNGAAVASRAMLQVLARHGFVVEALTGTSLETREAMAVGTWLTRRGLAFEFRGGESWTVSALGAVCDEPERYRLTIQGVPLTLYPSLSGLPPDPVGAGTDELLRLFETTLWRFRPNVVVNFGGDALAHQVRSRAKASGAAVVFALHNFSYPDAQPFANVDAVIAPSRFAAEHYRKTLGLDCTVLPNLVDFSRVKVQSHDPRYVTYVNPSYEKGVYVFARIADELGRRRPDIPLLERFTFE